LPAENGKANPKISARYQLAEKFLIKLYTRKRNTAKIRKKYRTGENKIDRNEKKPKQIWQTLFQFSGQQKIANQVAEDLNPLSLCSISNLANAFLGHIAKTQTASVARENLEKTKSFWALRVMEIAATT